MITLKLTKQEERALQALLWCNPCRSGCAWEEMEKSKKDCDECILSKAIQSIQDKLDVHGEKKNDK
jgi:hypothetical protein